MIGTPWYTVEMSRTRMCRYECGTELGDFDEKQNKYLEVSGTLHTRERCESLKMKNNVKVQVPHTQRQQPLTLEVVDARLKRLEAIILADKGSIGDRR